MFADHYAKVLVHRELSRQFGLYFVEQFHPLAETVTTDAPKIEKRFYFYGQSSLEPFLKAPPEEPVFNYLDIWERLKPLPKLDNSAWVDVCARLGLSIWGFEPDTGKRIYEPVFTLGKLRISSTTRPLIVLK